MSPFIAKPFICADPSKEESLGVAVSWIGDNLESEIIRPVMEKYGLGAFDPNTWYPTQVLLDIVHDLYKEQNTIDAFVAIGKKSAEDYPFPLEVKTLEDAVLAFNNAHHAVHRGIDPDQGFLIDKPEPNTLIVTNNNPWPGELIFGILWTLGKRFNAGRTFQVIPLPADEHGRAVFRVTW